MSCKKVHEGELIDNRSIVKGRWYLTRFGRIVQAKSSDPLQAFDDAIESLSDILGEVTFTFHNTPRLDGYKVMPGGCDD